MKKILVAGGCGFIGSNLCTRLLNDGHYVICVDNLFTGNLRNIAPFQDSKNFKFIRHDVIDYLQIEEKIDEIYDLACPASPVHYRIDPIKTAKTSVLGALNLLELATKNKARILLSSTSEVYGEPEVHPQPESYRGNVNPIGPRACYDEGKRMAETLFFDYRRQYGTDIKVVRIFNTYGPNMRSDDGRVVSNFIVQALKGENITVYGNGLQTRSFCYVDDLIAGMLAMMAGDDDFCGPVNLGNPEEFTMLELAEKVIRLTNSGSEIVYMQLPQDDPTKRNPNIELAKTKLQWQPKIHLDEGLKNTIDYFRNLLEDRYI